MPSSLYLIDGHAQIYRAYFAPFRTLNSPTGEPTRATYVFTQMLLSLIRDRRPDYLAMVLDADESKLHRLKIDPTYKAHREPPPEDLAPQEWRIVQILEAARVPLLRQTGYEADDIIATLVRRLAGPDLHVYIVSRDKDLDQLVSEHVTLYDPLKDEQITPASLLESKGWRPDQAIEAQILTGDTVDNVRGVMGVGPKTAAKLLQQYGSLAEIVAHADALTPKMRANLLEFVPHIERTRQLVTLCNDVECAFELDACRCERFAWAQAAPILAELGFRRLREQLPGGATEAGGDSAATGAAPSLFSEATQPNAAGPDERRVQPEARGPQLTGSPSNLRLPDGGEYRLVDSLATLDELAAGLAAQPAFALDTETTGVNPIDAELVGLSFAWEVGKGYYVPVRSVYGKPLQLDAVQARLGPILANAHTLKVGQNLKYDLLVLREAGLPVAGPMFDTMIAAFVVDPGAGSYSLDRMADRLLAHRMIPITDLIGGRGEQQLRMDQVPLDRIAEYASEDADYTWRLYQFFAPQIGSAGVTRLFHEIEMPLVAVLTEMELNGISIDATLLEAMGRELTERADRAATAVHKLAGGQFNLDSPKQLAEVLFDKLGYRVVRRTKTTRSTDADTLETLQRETGDEVFALLLEYREIQKLRGTYVDALPRERSRRTGRVHTSYHQTGAVTGRLSSSEPNLQNIPIRTEAGRQIRRAFVPRTPDEVLIVADYSQVELRVLAHLCEDENLVRAFREDHDIHAVVAAQVNGVPLAEVTREMRSRAKAVNFGIIYGQTAFGLSQSTGMSRGEAQAFIDAYFRGYPRIREFIERCIAEAKRDGHVRTLLGRQRPIENIDSRNASVRSQAERFAVNTVVQGSAADLIKIAMIRLHERIRTAELPLRMLLQVHDELVCEGPRARAGELAEELRAVMSGAIELRVPLKVDVAWGVNWLDAK